MDGHVHVVKELASQHARVEALGSRIGYGPNEPAKRFEKLDALQFDLGNRTDAMGDTRSKLGVKLPTLVTGGRGPRDKQF